MIGFSQATYKDSVQEIRNQQSKELFSPQNNVLNADEMKEIVKLDYFLIDSEKKIKAIFHVSIGKKFKMMTSSNETRTYRKYGTLQFVWNGIQTELIAYQNIELSKKKEHKNYLLIPFKDATSGDDTYGGGRYLDFEIPTSETVFLDFNLAYNPYCAYSHRYSCPIPPKENHLEIKIDAGEKTPIKE